VLATGFAERAGEVLVELLVRVRLAKLRDPMFERLSHGPVRPSRGSAAGEEAKNQDEDESERALHRIETIVSPRNKRVHTAATDNVEAVRDCDHRGLSPDLGRPQVSFSTGWPLRRDDELQSRGPGLDARTGRLIWTLFVRSRAEWRLVRARPERRERAGRAEQRLDRSSRFDHRAERWQRG
jgi:hypothetical protein